MLNLCDASPRKSIQAIVTRKEDQSFVALLFTLIQTAGIKGGSAFLVDSDASPYLILVSPVLPYAWAIP
jgi:hypothetical protein